MNLPDPPEGPEHHAGTLSPISPKPVHFPSPSNIPILENQMDPALDDPSLSGQVPSNNIGQDSEAQAAPAQPLESSSSPGVVAIPAMAATNPQDTPVGQPEQVTDTLTVGPSTDSASASVAPPPDLTSLDPSPASQSALEHGTPSSPAESAQPTSVTDASAIAQTLPNTDLSGINIQELLNSIHASDASAGLRLDALIGSNTASAPPSASASGAPDQASLLSPPTGLSIEAATPANTEAYSVVHAASEQPAEQALLAANGAFGSANGALAASDAPASMGSVSPGVDAAVPVNPAPQNETLLSPTEVPQTQMVAAPASTSAPASPLPNTVGHQPHNIDAKDGENVPWDKETQRKYDQFLDEERQYVLEGNWDRFPMGSRLFIGNLSSEKVTKRDLFHVFHRYGKLAQISIKQAYGFVQFLDAGDCGRALQHEQGVSIRGRKVHLEISKPQKTKNSSNANGNHEGRNARGRRSRSPERSGRNGDRHRGGNRRQQDNYRPQRSPSPRGRGGDSYRSRRSPDRYDGRRRSRSPYSRDSPRRQLGAFPDDGLPLPTRSPQYVPDLQILIKDLPDRSRPFIDYVRTSFQQRGLSVDDLFLIPRLDEAAVMRRQIIEGVLGVIRLDFETQHRQKFHLSVFDRSAGFGNVRFEEYKDMDLNICVELVLRAKQNAAQRPPTDYAMAQYGIPSVGGASSAASNPIPSPGAFGLPTSAQAPNPSALAGMDPGAIQRLLQGMQKGPPGQGPQLMSAQIAPPPGSMIGSTGPGGSSNNSMGFSGLPSPSAHAGFGGQFGKQSAPAYGMQTGSNTRSGGESGAGAALPAPGGVGGYGGGAPANGPDIQSIIAQLGQYRQ